MTPVSVVTRDPGHPGHLLLDERPHDRRRAVAAGAADRRVEERPPGRRRGPSHARMSRYSSSSATGASRSRPATSASPAMPSPATRGARSAARAAAARAPAAPPATRGDEPGDDRAPRRAGAQDHGGHAQVACGAARHTTATQPAGRGSGGAPGHTSRTSVSSGPSASATTTAETGRSIAAPLGMSRAPSIAGMRASSEMSARPVGAAAVRAFVVTAPHNGALGGVFQATGPRGPAVCPPGETSRTPFGPSSQSAHARGRRIIRRC